MPSPSVTALADRVRADLERGRFAGLGPVDFGPGDVCRSAARAARIVLADVDHCAQLEEERDGPVPAERWAGLADQLRRLRETARRAAEDPAER
jgi:hypothetical protein